jgi:hypothetical protein
MTGDTSARDLAAGAREGDFDGLFALADQARADPEVDADVLLYKWLCVAADFGHEEADELIEDLMEVSSLRFDDDGFAVGSAHFELGLAYLSGEDGLPLNLEHGRAHLEEAVLRHWPAGIQEAHTVLAEARETLSGEGRVVFDELFAVR